MTPATVTPEELRAALIDLAVAAGSFARGRGLNGPRANLLGALKHANAVSHAAVVTMPVTDAEALVTAFAASGGNWADLVAAVNRHALEGATRR